jgi:hypothetical protein
MIVALSSLALYSAPDEVSSSTPLRVIFTLLGGLGGIYLLLIGSVYLVQYLVTLNGYGAPYLAPFSPMISKDLLRDGIVRGNYLNMRSSARIGLLPQDVSERSRAIGNAALAGAQMILLNRRYETEAKRIAEMAHTLELSTDPVFTEEYMMGMVFEEV